MKKTIYQLLILLVAVNFIACEEQKGCTDPLALNFNPDVTINDGSCVYNLLPVIDSREKYLGNYMVRDSLYTSGSLTSVTDYTLSIITDSTVSDTLFLINLWGDNSTYIALMSNDNFTIPSQQVSGPYYTTGYGQIVDGVIDYRTSGDSYTHRGLGRKQ